MPVTIVVGTQWGDEGKGRVVDWIASQSEWVARYAGGDNAGHTVAVGDIVYKMHLVPSGVLHKDSKALLGNGMVINPVNLVKEIENLRAQHVTISPQNLWISSRAHMILPAHIEQDRMKEAARGEEAIGTTLRGIGPAYLAKAERKGLRMGDMLDVEEFAEKLRGALSIENEILEPAGYGVDIEKSVQLYVDAAHFLKPFIHDTSSLLHQEIQSGAKIVCEGAQGTLLDIDHGSYPFVTSSSPTVGGALTGLGISPFAIDRVVGVAKAFSTRVGGGPMPTELDDRDPIAQRLRGTGANFWDEYGTTTGRPRRTGWLDGVMLRYAAHINGLTDIVITKLDILSGFDELKIAVAYELNGERIDTLPATTSEIEKCIPIYERFDGWDADLTGLRNWDDLPETAQKYVTRIAEICEADIMAVSVGPERDQLIVVKS
ncbi:adenylosuccinate synthase [Anaerolineales bacterium]